MYKRQEKRRKHCPVPVKFNYDLWPQTVLRGSGLPNQSSRLNGAYLSNHKSLKDIINGFLLPLQVKDVVKHLIPWGSATRYSTIDLLSFSPHICLKLLVNYYDCQELKFSVGSRENTIVVVLWPIKDLGFELLPYRAKSVK